jgi:hypothetical protein
MSDRAMSDGVVKPAVGKASDQAVWTRRPAPAPAPGAVEAWRGQPRTLAELSRSRAQLRAALGSGALPSGADDGERLLLVFEELVSNGLRHGRPPVRVTVTSACTSWLLVVSDGAADQPPVHAVDRDAAHGGMGLDLVAGLSGAHGWAVEGDRKVVWARIAYATAPDPSLERRVRAARARARDLAAGLSATAALVEATLHGLAVAAAAGGRPDAARSCRAGAECARRVAEQARLMSTVA